ncbi:MAG: 4-hydroxy-tetrahydrodipicolinate synthase [Atribacterota bacterium]|jgi:4-hydroxy-tetrahydrodipicolinate synthase|nr:4-hydroxy-tetrahydrodipicolinate synthase [Atribacterota bacterium]MDD4895164.1 4-hydroxy-tetrahydrodipicolinate synthase [Atribacterota bacterium]MDD5637187.1 4-hydroxy-tetrahydrodipicolinate synthase [Atribacterota bacterium]
MFSGSIVALITPFDEHNQIDEKGIKKLVEFHINNGTNAIVPCGTTGESPTLTHEEHKKVIELTIKAVAGRVPVIAGTGSNSTAETLDLTASARDMGSNGVLLVVPYYNKPTQRGLYIHFKTIVEQIDIPAIIYNIPSRAGVNLLPSTLAELAELKNIVAVKEASGNLEQMAEIMYLCGDKITLLSGDDKIIPPVMSIGGKGVISVVANIIPDKVSSMIKAYLEGNSQEALEIFQKVVYPLSRVMFYETNPIPVKTAARLIGLPAGDLRLPLVDMEENNFKKLKEDLKRFGLLEE